MKTVTGKEEELQGLEVAAVNVLNRAMSDGCGGYEWAKAELRELVRHAWDEGQKKGKGKKMDGKKM